MENAGLENGGSENAGPENAGPTTCAENAALMSIISERNVLITRLNVFARSCLFNATAVAAQCYSQQTNSDSLARRHHQVRSV